jgi:hypothetical protein
MLRGLLWWSPAEEGTWRVDPARIGDPPRAARPARRRIGNDWLLGGYLGLFALALTAGAAWAWYGVLFAEGFAHPMAVFLTAPAVFMWGFLTWMVVYRRRKFGEFRLAPPPESVRRARAWPAAMAVVERVEGRVSEADGYRDAGSIERGTAFFRVKRADGTELTGAVEFDEAPLAAGDELTVLVPLEEDETPLVVRELDDVLFRRF